MSGKAVDINRGGTANLGGGFSHVPGEPWLEAKWKAFELWASRNGACVSKDAMVYWKSAGTFHRDHGYPAFIDVLGNMTWWHYGTNYYGVYPEPQ